jgi:hypothetical protein
MFLRFVYTGTVPEDAASEMTMETWAELFQVADRFDVRDLFALAQHKMSLLLEPGNACTCLSLTTRYQAAALLKEAVFDFISRNKIPAEDLDKLDGDTLRELVRRNARLIIVQPQHSDVTDIGAAAAAAGAAFGFAEDDASDGEGSERKRKLSETWIPALQQRKRQ